MKCGKCITKIKEKMREDHDLNQVEVHLQSKSVVFLSDSIVPLEAKKTVESCGFQVMKMEVTQ